MANQIDDKPLLPKEYVQLEYLEFTGTQWIDTRITPILSDELEFECIVKQPSTSQWAIFGSGTGNILWGFVGSDFRVNTFGGYYKYFESGSARMTLNIPQSTDNLNIINCKNDGYFYVNGVQYYSTPNAFNDVELSTPLYLGTRGSKAQFFTGVIGKFKLMDKNGELKLNLIPVLHIADLKPGMYDLVTGQFFTNQGIGEFVFEMPNDLKPYLYFEALENDLQVSITKSATQYSLDKVNWIDLTKTESTPPINQGQKIYFKGNAALDNNGIGTFTLTKLCRVGGNPNSLHYGDSFDKYNNISSLLSLFKGNQNLLEIANPKIFITNKTGGRLNQYREMFYGCSNLVNAPIIYIKTVGVYALRDMFREASNINYVVMLAEELSENIPFQTWLYKAASSGTIVLNKNITWNPSEVPELIPNSKWEVKYCDPDNLDDVRDYREIDKAWNE